MMLRKIVSLGVEVDELKAALALKTAADENAAKIENLTKGMGSLTKTIEDMRKI